MRSPSTVHSTYAYTHLYGAFCAEFQSTLPFDRTYCSTSIVGAHGPSFYPASSGPERTITRALYRRSYRQNAFFKKNRYCIRTPKIQEKEKKKGPWAKFWPYAIPVLFKNASILRVVLEDARSSLPLIPRRLLLPAYLPACAFLNQTCPVKRASCKVLGCVSENREKQPPAGPTVCTVCEALWRTRVIMLCDFHERTRV